MCSSVITLMLQLVELEQISTTLNAASLIYNDRSEFISWFIFCINNVNLQSNWSSQINVE